MPNSIRWISSCIVVVFAVALTLILAGQGQAVDGADNGTAVAEAKQNDWPTKIDATKVEGHEKCVDCHKTEIKAWLTTKHATRAFDLLRTAPTAREYAEKLGIRQADIARNSLCVDCHATAQVKPTGHVGVIGGVSCEACHSPSGGENGWLNPHAVYGSRGTRREQESAEHYAQRLSTCQEAGQLGSSRLYQLAKRCFQCHVVGDEKLAEAGHDHGDRFALTERMLGEVRHNFLLDEKTNAEVATLWTDPLHNPPDRTAAGRKRVIFVTGQLVDLEISFRNLAKASEENDLSDLMFDRIEAAYELLSEDLLEELKETKLPEVEQVIKTVEPVWTELDDDGFNPDNKQKYIDTANAVGKAAQEFSLRDGNDLAEIDGLDLIPAGPYEGVFQP